ncbi:MAG: histidine--tRNA ligase [Nitrososphaerota archaeon]|jgi:histidyl-tRNA synthetase|nr:histidine--tRNA ligase [Nitrososphaerota archaeon]
MPTFQTVRGMRDLFGKEAQTFTHILDSARRVASLFGFREVFTPHVESLELLNAKSGEEIRQRMFIFEDLGGRKVALRPEFTASIARLATTSLKTEPKPLKMFSTGTVYRYDEPQRGRYREFWQSNFELLGSNKPESDAEIILLTNKFLQTIGLQGFAFKIGHIGIIRSILSQDGVDEKTQNAVLQRMDKKEYDLALKLVDSEKCRYTLQSLINVKGKNWQDTIDQINVVVSTYEKAKIATENLFEVLTSVTSSTKISLTVEPAFARGLEYYTGIIFEVYIPQLEIALGGGGRYDHLIETFGGEPTPAVGCAHGLDRVTIALQTQNTECTVKTSYKIVVIPISESVKIDALKIAQLLREHGISVEFELMGRKMGKALEDADKRSFDYAIIVGEQELKEGAVVVKDLKTREQTTVSIDCLLKKLKIETFLPINK